MNKLKKSLIVAALVSFSVTAFGERVSMRTPAGFQALDSAGNSLSAAGAGAFRFDVGVFGPGASPSTPFGEWEQNFTTLATGTWGVSGPTANRLNSNFNQLDGGLAGQQGFIWGYDNKAIDPVSDWIVVTNENWIFPTPDPLSLTLSPENIWSFADAGTTVFGGVGNLTAEGFTMTAIPEPSTYALIFGFGVLGLVVVRRIRSQK